MGIVIKDSRGAFLAAKAIRLNRAREVDQVEALAILAGMDSAKEMGFGRITIEEDFESVINRVLDRSNSLTVVEVILEDIRRGGNSIAHNRRVPKCIPCCLG